MLTFLISTWFNTDAAAAWDAKNPGVFHQHLETTVPDVKLQGSLLDREGKRCGIFAVVHSSDFAGVDRWIENSPYQRAGLYTRTEVHQVVIQSGTLA